MMSLENISQQIDQFLQLFSDQDIYFGTKWVWLETILLEFQLWKKQIKDSYKQMKELFVSPTPRIKPKATEMLYRQKR